MKKIMLKSYAVIGGIILILSLMTTFNMCSSISKYRYRIGTDACNYIENIKSLNESNLSLLKAAIDIGSIENMDIVKLYENYKTISGETMILWNEYLFFEENKSAFEPNKEVYANNAILSDVNGCIRDLFYTMLEDEMKNQNYKLEITSEVFLKLDELKKLSEEIQIYFNNFSDEKLAGLSAEERKKVIIKNYYWIDMLQGINNINENYMEKII